jgi:quinolinate synthase
MDYFKEYNEIQEELQKAYQESTQKARDLLVANGFVKYMLEQIELGNYDEIVTLIKTEMGSSMDKGYLLRQIAKHHTDANGEQT